MAIESTHIYSLSDPKTGFPVYVGKADKLSDRYRGHMKEKYNKRKVQWILSLRMNGLKPVMDELDLVPVSEWRFWERHYISLYKSWGFCLFNLTDGGDQPPAPPSRVGIEPWNKGLTNIYSEQTRNNISNSLKERFKDINNIIYKKTSYKIHQNIFEDYKSGECKTVLAKKYGLSVSAVSVLLVKFGVETNEVHRMNSDISGKIFNDFKNSKLTIKEIGNKYGFEIGAVSRSLRKRGINIRKSKGRLIVSEFTRRKLSESLMGGNCASFKKGEVSYNAKSVIQLSRDGVFIKEWRSSNDATVNIGVNNIIACLNGKRKSAGGFIWKHKK